MYIRIYVYMYPFGETPGCLSPALAASWPTPRKTWRGSACGRRQARAGCWRHALERATWHLEGINPVIWNISRPYIQYIYVYIYTVYSIYTVYYTVCIQYIYSIYININTVYIYRVFVVIIWSISKCEKTIMRYRNPASGKR